MKKKIKVEFSRVYEVDGSNSYEAENQAVNMAMEELESLQCDYKGKDLTARLFRVFKVEKYIEPIDWRNEAEEDGKRLADDIKEETKEAVKKYKEKSGIKKVKEDEDIERIANEIYDEFYQDKDISYQATEYADGYFIYNSTDAIIEALQCIDRLSDYEETDRGLWEELKTIEEQINARATYTYGNAVYASAEEVIKNRIRELL